MTRKDYILIAEVIKNAELSQGARDLLTQDFSAMLIADNERFNIYKFREACGL